MKNGYHMTSADGHIYTKLVFFWLDIWDELRFSVPDNLRHVSTNKECLSITGTRAMDDNERRKLDIWHSQVFVIEDVDKLMLWRMST